MFRLPQFSIAQLMGFTALIAINAWAVMWNSGAGLWVILLSQIAFWTLLRINAGLRVDPELMTRRAADPVDWTITKLAIVSFLCSLGGVIAFGVVCTVTATPLALRGTSTNSFPIVLFAVSIPLGTLAAAVWLWWTWPRK